MAKLKPTDRRLITVENTAFMRPYGGTRGPILEPYKESVYNIEVMLRDKVEIYGVSPTGKKTKLTLENYNLDDSLGGTSLEPESQSLSANPKNDQPKVITCAPTSLNLNVGDKNELKVNIENCVFEVDNNSLASVKANSKLTAEVTAIKPGKATVTISKSGFNSITVPVKIAGSPQQNA